MYNTMKYAKLTPPELEVLNIVWNLGQATVRDVYETILKRRHIAYTTVLTMMRILEEKKGYLRKSTRDRAYVYEPTISQKEARTTMTREFLDRVFDGSARPLMAQLVETGSLSRKDIEEIKRLIERKS
jgi:BlaI family transcriptional regulator, penicillinase repressor